MAGLTYILQRFSDNRDSTLGILMKIILQTGKEVPVFQGYSLEDQFQLTKVPKETRIPAGIYNVDIQKAETPKTLQYRKKYPWFKNHLEVKNVQGFVGVYIHVGNTDDDSEACILLGDNADNNVIGPGSISNSTACFKRFYESVYSHLPITLIIRDESYLVDK
jgi:hypothetical protein